MKLKEYGLIDSILNEEGILNEKFALFSSELKYNILFFSQYDSNSDLINDFLLEAMVVVYNLNFDPNNYFVDEFKFKKSAQRAVDFIVNNFSQSNIKFYFREKDFFFEYENVVWHSLNVAVLSYLIGMELHYSDKDLNRLIVAAFFHDIGKVLIDSTLLNKREILTSKEKYEMMKHSTYSKKFLSHLKCIDREMEQAILAHHEKLDGSGYPDELISHEIPEMARIICIADIFEAMISDKVYREGFPISEIFEMMYSDKFGKLDYNIINKLKKIIKRSQGG